MTVLEPQVLFFPLVVCCLAAGRASSMGYSPFAWFGAAGPLGLFVLWILPDLKNSTRPAEERAKIKRWADTFAWCLTGLGTLAMIGISTGLLPYR